MGIIKMKAFNLAALASLAVAQYESEPPLVPCPPPSEDPGNYCDLDIEYCMIRYYGWGMQYDMGLPLYCPNHEDCPTNYCKHQYEYYTGWTWRCAHCENDNECHEADENGGSDDSSICVVAASGKKQCESLN